MSILSRAIQQIWSGALRPIINLIIPKRCGVCGCELNSGHKYVCSGCRLDAPLTGFWLDTDNPMTRRIKALRPDIEHVSALLFYINESSWRDMIHRFKYNGEWRHGVELGVWFGGELRRSKLYDTIDTVISIPLHPRREIVRGYNQSDYFAHGLSRSLGIEQLRGAVKRRRHNPPQAKHSRDERWSNAENLFEVPHPERLKGRNILLVDDVFTTGATMLSCAEVILDTVPDCRVWIVAMAVSHREFGFGG